MPLRYTLLLSACLLLACFPACQQNSAPGRGLRTPPAYRFRPVSTPVTPRSVGRLARETNIKTRIISSASVQRKASHRLRPTFITIHSTANHNATATAMQHSQALCRGAFTNRSWHFSADQYMVVQNLPLTETGWHAGNAVGNNNSIGIELCEAENRGHNHFRTWDRGAKLTALLMKRYNIRLRHVVPHQYWTGKNCPTPLLNNGKPGPKWAWFLSRVDYYYRCINEGQSFR